MPPTTPYAAACPATPPPPPTPSGAALSPPAATSPSARPRSWPASPSAPTARCCAPPTCPRSRSPGGTSAGCASRSPSARSRAQFTVRESKLTGIQARHDRLAWSPGSQQGPPPGGGPTHPVINGQGVARAPVGHTTTMGRRRSPQILAPPAGRSAIQGTPSLNVGDCQQQRAAGVVPGQVHPAVLAGGHQLQQAFGSQRGTE